MIGKACGHEVRLLVVYRCSMGNPGFEKILRRGAVRKMR